MKINENIKKLRNKNSVTQSELARAIGVSRVTVQYWEHGTRKPSMSAIESIANYFGVSTDYLLGINSTPEFYSLTLSEDEEDFITAYRSLDDYGKKAVKTVCEVEAARVNSETRKKIAKDYNLPTSKNRYIPRYLTPAAAGSSIPLDGDDFEMILVDDQIPANADFAVKIQGDSMLPYISDGDTVFVKRCCDLNTGDIGIFSVNGAMYCKQYYIDSDNNLTLISLNPEYKNTNVYVSADCDSNVKCYGKVLTKNRIKIPTYMLQASEE